MPDISPTLQWILDGLTTLLLGVFLWRSNQVAGEFKVVWQQIDELRKADSANEKTMHAHEVEALNARLDFKDQITAILLANNTVASDAKNTAAGVVRLEKEFGERMGRFEENLREIVKGVKGG